MFFVWVLLLANFLRVSCVKKSDIIMASQSFPQLYGCIQEKENNCDLKAVSKSQSHEDLWLLKNIFSKLTVDELLGGTFLEIGALDGITYSNTHLFEKKYDWRGVLVEGHPLNQEKLRANAGLRKNSAIFTTAICNLTSHGHPGSANFTSGGGAVGAMVSEANPKFMKYFHSNENNNYVSVPCIPLTHILVTTGMFDIDLFSLDVEGGELFVLHTLDFDLINIRVIIVEADGDNPGKDQNVRDLLIKNGFVNALATLGSTSEACDDKKSGCTSNDVFINPHFTARKVKRAALIPFPRYFHYGMPCAYQGNHTTLK